MGDLVILNKILPAQVIFRRSKDLIDFKDRLRGLNQVPYGYKQNLGPEYSTSFFVFRSCTSYQIIIERNIGLRKYDQ